jgi:hypothetical protein
LFEEAGYAAVAPGWPGDPETVAAHPRPDRQSYRGSVPAHLLRHAEVDVEAHSPLGTAGDQPPDPGRPANAGQAGPDHYQGTAANVSAPLTHASISGRSIAKNSRTSGTP